MFKLKLKNIVLPLFVILVLANNNYLLSNNKFVKVTPINYSINNEYLHKIIPPSSDEKLDTIKPVEISNLKNTLETEVKELELKIDSLNREANKQRKSLNYMSDGRLKTQTEIKIKKIESNIEDTRKVIEGKRKLANSMSKSRSTSIKPEPEDPSKLPDILNDKVVRLWNKPYYAKLFSLKHRQRISLTMVEYSNTDTIFKNAKKKDREAKQMFRLADKSKGKWGKKRLTKKATELQNQASTEKLAGLNRISTTNANIYNLYKDNVWNARYRAANQDIPKGQEIEKKAYKYYAQATSLKEEAIALDLNGKIKHTELLNKWELAAILSLERVFAIYMGDEELVIDVKKRDAELLSQKLDSLIKSNPSHNWGTAFRLSGEVNDFLSLADETTDPNVRKTFNDQAKNALNRELNKIQEDINFSQNQNSKNFKDYLSRFSEIDRNVKTAEIRRATLIEKEAINYLNKSKKQLELAYFLREAVATGYKNAKTEVEKVNLLNDKYKIYEFMQQAIDFEDSSLVKQQKALDLFFTYGAISSRPTKKDPNNPTNKSTNKNTKKTSKSTKKKTTSTNTSTSSDIYFRIQIATFETEVSKKNFKGFPVSTIISEKMKETGLVAYLQGKYNQNETNVALKKAVNAGYSDAFVVAYNKGKRIPLFTARELLKNKKQTTFTYGTSIKADPAKATNPANAKNIKASKGLIYTVQIAYVDNPVGSKQLLNLTPLYKDVNSNEKIRYSVGTFKNETEAIKAQYKIIELGVKDAYVTAYHNGKRIEIIEARTIQKSNKKSKKTSDKGIVFKVQVASGKGKLPAKDQELYKKIASGKKLERIAVKKGNTIYIIGDFFDYNEAAEIKNRLKKEGKDSFIIAYKNRKKIDVTEAIKLLK